MKANRGSLPVAVAIALASLLLCVSEARAYDFVPILSVFYAGPSRGSQEADASTCLSRGGYLATEATATLHAADIATIADNLGPDTNFYAYLGGGINLQFVNGSLTTAFCGWNSADPSLPSTTNSITTTGSRGCLYRWRVGRWEMMTSDSGFAADQEHAGIAFFKGQVTTVGSIFGFPTWFLPGEMWLRPGFLGGRSVVLFQNAETKAQALAPMWTDNYFVGGYTYADVTKYDAAAALATLTSFHTLCQAQGPFRLNYEVPAASTPQRSALQYLWWVIFFVILFVLCLIAFLIVACCQEREDMDEPPEDAPEWAERETAERSVSKRYVSQRSFRGDDGYGERRHSSRYSSRHSSFHSGETTPSKEDTYSDGE